MLANGTVADARVVDVMPPDLETRIAILKKKALEEQKQSGIKDKLVGLRLQGRGVLREGYAVHIPGTKRTGTVTSGTFSPTLGYSIALARVPVLAKNEAQVMIRGKLVPCDVVKPCFVRNGQPIIPVTDMA